MFKKIDDMREEHPIKWYLLSIVRAIVVGLLAVVAVVGIYLLLATVLEFRPADTETVAVKGTAEPLAAGQTTAGHGDAAQTTTGQDDTAQAGAEQELTVMTWNIGYSALGDDADFFMDGGASVRASTQERVEQNLNAIVSEIREADPDVVFLQEIDQSSTRSYRINEVERMQSEFPAMQQSFANNFKAFYIPYPIPMMGKVDSGIATLSKYEIASAERISLPCPFSWPTRTMNLKRCLLVSRMELPDTDAQLVLINLHLEAYDDGEGRAEQTRLLKELMDAEVAKGNYVLAGGDFNQTFDTVDASLYPAQEGNWAANVIGAADLGSGWQLIMDDTTPTCRLLNQPYNGADKETFQYYMLDGFIASANLTVESCETMDLDFVNADHNPVLLKIQLDT